CRGASSGRRRGALPRPRWPIAAAAAATAAATAATAIALLGRTLLPVVLVLLPVLGRPSPIPALLRPRPRPPALLAKLSPPLLLFSRANVVAVVAAVWSRQPGWR
ncbi:unnamed protein product, partial [Ectocarpus sp. 13 AM-2016]